MISKLKYTSDIAFTSSVKAIQEKFQSRRKYAGMKDLDEWQSEITPQLLQYLGGMDSFHLSISSDSGQPYTQYHKGAKEFLKEIIKSQNIQS